MSAACHDIMLDARGDSCLDQVAVERGCPGIVFRSPKQNRRLDAAQRVWAHEPRRCRRKQHQRYHARVWFNENSPRLVVRCFSPPARASAV
jgi:hypothetical protein